MKTRITQLTVTSGDIYADDATIIEIDDHGGGEFITMRQPGAEQGGLTFDHKNWPAVRDAADQMLKFIEDNENDTEQNR